MTARTRPTPGNRPAWWDDGNDRAMLICRISDRKQKDGVSLDAQQRAGGAYAAHADIRLAEVRSFQESAKRSELRVTFHAAIEQARRANIKHLIFPFFDRMARNFTDWEMLEEMIRDGSIVLHVVASGLVLHKDSPDSDFFATDINIAQAKQENRTRTTKTIDGMEERCERGWYPSRPPQFYEHRPVLDEAGRPLKRGSTIEGPSEAGRRLVRREMELHLQGFSLDRIRERCLSEGLVPAKMVRSYTKSIIDRHLKSEFYAALPAPRQDPERPGEVFKSQFTWRGTTYAAKHEPIFSYVEWEQLRASFGQKSTYRKLKHDGLFAQGPLSLTCATEGCGCKITYAPKSKKKGVTYRYYRCADGKRVHVGREEKQINVREEEILDQLGTALDAIALTPDVVQAIVNGLNETHRTAMQAKQRAAEGYRATAKELEAREDRLFDRFDANEIDRATYDRQLARLRAEKAETFEKLRQADETEDSKYLVTAERVLELAKSAKSLWETRSAQERRDLLERLVCNPRLEGRTVRYDLKKPFSVLAQMHGEGGWRPQRDSNPC